MDTWEISHAITEVIPDTSLEIIGTKWLYVPLNDGFSYEVPSYVIVGLTGSNFNSADPPLYIIKFDWGAKFKYEPYESDPARYSLEEYVYGPKSMVVEKLQQ